MILDTTFLVDLLRGDSAARSKATTLESEATLIRVPTPAIYELWEGVELARNPPKEMFRVREVLEDYTLLPLDPRHAMRAGTLSGTLHRRGITLDDVDALIAGAALEERDAVLTRNVKDFQRVPDLVVETY